jgi:hypothetical protein
VEREKKYTNDASSPLQRIFKSFFKRSGNENLFSLISVIYRKFDLFGETSQRNPKLDDLLVINCALRAVREESCHPKST